MTSETTSNPSPRRARARRGEGERLRDEIIAAATDLLLVTGDEEAVSIRAVAEAVGVSPTAIYLHFADKHELIFAICQQQFADFADALSAASEGVDDPVAAIEAVARAYVAFGLGRPAAYRILFMTEHTIPESVEAKELEGMLAFHLLVDLVTRGMERGALRRADPVTTAIGLWGSVHGVVALLIAMADEPLDLPWPDTDDLVDHQLAACLHGIAAR